jgi:hypothetical protein
MKYVLVIILFFSLESRAQLFSKTNIISYSLCFAAGLSDGMNDAIVAHDPYPDSQFWSLYNKNSYYNKNDYGWVRKNVLTFSTDGYHLTKFTTYALYGVAVGIRIGEKQNWKQTLLKSGIAFLSARVGRELTYNLIK